MRKSLFDLQSFNAVSLASVFKYIFGFFAAIATLCHPAFAQDPPPIYPVEAYAKLPRLSQPRLSLVGKSVAYITSIVNGRKSVDAERIKWFTAMGDFVDKAIGGP